MMGQAIFQPPCISAFQKDRKKHIKRLILRELTESDDDALYRVLDDSDIRGTRPIRSTKRASAAGFAATSRAIKYSASACGQSAAKTPAR